MELKDSYTYRINTDRMAEKGTMYKAYITNHKIDYNGTFQWHQLAKDGMYNEDWVTFTSPKRVCNIIDTWKSKTYNNHIIFYKIEIYFEGTLVGTMEYSDFQSAAEPFGYLNCDF